MYVTRPVMIQQTKKAGAELVQTLVSQSTCCPSLLSLAVSVDVRHHVYFAPLGGGGGDARACTDRHDACFTVYGQWFFFTLASRPQPVGTIRDGSTRGVHLHCHTAPEL